MKRFALILSAFFVFLGSFAGSVPIILRPTLGTGKGTPPIRGEQSGKRRMPQRPPTASHDGRAVCIAAVAASGEVSICVTDATGEVAFTTTTIASPDGTCTFVLPENLSGECTLELTTTQCTYAGTLFLAE